ncbi:MAG: protein kinase [Actinomycetota bacterium]|nr:protein kinase [Actinomycetota bacterium]
MGQGEHDRIGLEAAAREAADAGSFVPDVVAQVRSSTLTWEVSSAPEEAPVWIYVDPPDPPSVSVGWKLHVSAALISAQEVLERSLAVLLREKSPFKLAASFRVLEALNEGEAGLSQIGKFLTVYPSDDARAVDLARKLDAATRGLRGPRVPSDRPLAPGSLVHYRYGTFDAPDEQQPGDSLAARSTYVAPESVQDPFLLAGVTEPETKGLIDGRLYLSSTIHRSARGAVHTAVDIKELRDCIVKRASRDARLGPDGLDARDQLRDEAAVLGRLEGRAPVPKVFDLLDHETDLLLVMEKVPGAPLGAVVHRMFADKAPPDLVRVVRWATKLAGALAAVHEQGLVYRDLNPANALVTREGMVSLIDFELTRPAGSSTEFYTAGTPGFLSRQQAEGLPASPSDDVYSLGALIAFTATGERPSGISAADAIRRRFGSDGTSLAKIVERCLAHGPDERWAEMRSLEAALADAAA